MPRLESKGLAVRRVTPTELMVMTGYVQLACSGRGVRFEEYHQLLRSLAAVDKNGKLWSLGVNGGTWYQREGENWVPGSPEGDLYLIRAVDLRRTARRAGKRIRQTFLPPVWLQTAPAQAAWQEMARPKNGKPTILAGQCMPAVRA